VNKEVEVDFVASAYGPNTVNFGSFSSFSTFKRTVR